MALDLSLPTPTPATINPCYTTNNFYEIGTANAADVKDLGVSGTFISGGTKYAVMYREASTGNFRIGTTSTAPTSTVTGVTAADFEFANAYLNSLTIAGLTANSILATDASKNATVTTKLYITPSFFSAYCTYTGSTVVTANTWVLMSTRATITMPTSTANFTTSTAVANTGVKYTGAPAIVQVSMTIMTNAANVFCAITTGVGTPAAPADTTTRRSNVSIQRNDSLSSTTLYLDFITTMNTNDELAIYLGSQGTRLAIGTWTVSGTVLGYT